MVKVIGIGCFTADGFICGYAIAYPFTSPIDVLMAACAACALALLGTLMVAIPS